MKPVLILQHMVEDSPGYLATWLQRHGRPFEVRNSAVGEAFPDSLQPYSALAILGGAMSANDDLPSLRQAERLVREGVAGGVPVIGHCLGGQLMAKALGAAVTASPAPEIGWQTLLPEPTTLARDWLGAEALPEIFHWHYEAFGLPTGATLLASSPACPHQAFVIGPHLAMQFHVELDASKLAIWTAEPDDDHSAALARHPSVQSFAAMHEDAAQRLARQQRLADRLYARWWAGVHAG